MVSRKSIVERVDRRTVATQHGLADTVEINDSRGHGIILLGALRYRGADQLVGKRRGKLLVCDQALRVRRSGGERDAAQNGSRNSQRNPCHAYPPDMLDLACPPS